MDQGPQAKSYNLASRYLIYGAIRDGKHFSAGPLGKVPICGTQIRRPEGSEVVYRMFGNGCDSH